MERLSGFNDLRGSLSNPNSRDQRLDMVPKPLRISISLGDGKIYIFTFDCPVESQVRLTELV